MGDFSGAPQVCSVGIYANKWKWWSRELLIVLEPEPEGSI